MFGERSVGNEDFQDWAIYSIIGGKQGLWKYQGGTLNSTAGWRDNVNKHFLGENTIRAGTINLDADSSKSRIITVSVLSLWFQQGSAELAY